jgi:hypothetical protein
VKLESDIKNVKNKIKSLDELLPLVQNIQTSKGKIYGGSNLGINMHNHNDSVFQQRYRSIARAQEFVEEELNNKGFYKTKSPSLSTSLPNFRVNMSQLPTNNLSSISNALGKRVNNYLLEGYSDFLAKKVIPIPGLEANFCYDFSENTTTWQGPMQIIYGFNGFNEKIEASFEEVLGLVVFRDKQRFEDVVFDSVTKKNHVITKPILLENENTIIEEYNFLYHKGDYEKRSPALLQGKTKIVRTTR